MFSNDRHLNIFEHYIQKDALPIENNISRGLAILLNQNSLVLDRFIDFLNTKCIEKKSTCSVPKPQKISDKDIGIQQQIIKIVQSYPNPQNIVGITLTTSSPVNMFDNKNNDNSGLIPDIIISCKDTLVIIEVKRNAADARLQLRQQVKSIAAEVVRQGGNLPDIEYLDGTWEELISILQDVYNISGSDENSILGHYLNHLENHYQQWFPVALLTEIPIEHEYDLAIEKRILSLIKNCCPKEHDAEKYAGRYIIPLEYEFCTEAQISMDYDTKRLMITIWCGDTKWQGYCLFNKTKHDLSWIYEDEITIDGIELDILTEPYLRLAHFQSTIIAEYISKDYFHIHYGDSKNKCMELYSEITKEWKRPDWPAFMKLLEKKYNGMLDMNSFNSEFSNKFENSNRNYAHVSFGFETTVYLPIDVISKFEKNNSSLKDSDKLARFIMKIVDELLEKIE